MKINLLYQGPATHGITGATSGGSGAAKYNFICFFLNFMTIKIFFLTHIGAASGSGAACCRALYYIIIITIFKLLISDQLLISD